MGYAVLRPTAYLTAVGPPETPAIIAGVPYPVPTHERYPQEGRANVAPAEKARAAARPRQHHHRA